MVEDALSVVVVPCVACRLGGSATCTVNGLVGGVPVRELTARPPSAIPAAASVEATGNALPVPRDPLRVTLVPLVTPRSLSVWVSLVGSVPPKDTPCVPAGMPVTLSKRVFS